MSDIKSLFYTAKQSGAEKDINAYVAAVNEAATSNPNNFVANLEYIISSSATVPTVLPFIEKYGMPIPMYSVIKECVDKCMDKYKLRGYNTDIYHSLNSYLDTYKTENTNLMAMYEYYQPEDNTTYTKAYYGETRGRQNRMLLAGMIKQFGEMAIPDAIITTRDINRKTGNDASSTTITNYLKSIDRTPVLNEWLSTVEGPYESFNEEFYPESATAIFKTVQQRNHEIYRESWVMGKPEVQYEATEEEIAALQDLASFREFMMLGKAVDGNHISMESINEVYAELANITTEFDEEDADLVDMAPQSKMEAPAWTDETSDKKTGSIPPYLKRNHDMVSWGEDEPSKKSSDEDEYKRPSAEDNKSVDTPSASSTTTHTTNDEDEEDEVKDPRETKSSTSMSNPVTNYYYYTYTNSLNKNDHSFNRSNYDNHSVDDHSSNHDDHSMNKHSKSDNTTTTSNGVTQNTDDDKEESVNESVLAPWELDLGFTTLFNEAASQLIGEAADIDDVPTDTYDDEKPKSDHPIKDAMLDIDRKLTKVQQKVKKGVQDTVNVGKAAIKPVKRTKDWISGMVTKWKDVDETNIKEKLASPKEKFNLFTAIRDSIKTGALLKAGILLNPIFLALAVIRKNSNSKHEMRLKNEMQLEIQQEMKILDEKIEDARNKANYGDDAERAQARRDKYKLMRFKTELQKKLWRVQGNKNVVNMI